MVGLPHPQTHALPGGQAEEPKGLLWILDEEALIQGSSDSTALNRLCSYFAKEGVNKEGKNDRHVNSWSRDGSSTRWDWGGGVPSLTSSGIMEGGGGGGFMAQWWPAEAGHSFHPWGALPVAGLGDLPARGPATRLPVRRRRHLRLGAEGSF